MRTTSKCSVHEVPSVIGSNVEVKLRRCEPMMHLSPMCESQQGTHPTAEVQLLGVRRKDEPEHGVTRVIITCAHPASLQFTPPLFLITHTLLATTGHCSVTHRHVVCDARQRCLRLKASYKRAWLAKAPQASLDIIVKISNAAITPLSTAKLACHV